MLTRRDFLQVSAAAAAILGGGNMSLAAARQSLTQKKILEFDSVGQVTLLNFADCHAQLMPLYFREPSFNVGVGAATGLPPHITGKKLLEKFEIRPGTPEAHAFSSHDFVALSQEYGKVGGLAHMATLINAVRAERPSNTLLVDCGDTWQGSYSALKTRGADMVEVMNALGVDVMTAHWEFTYGTERVKELIEKLKFPFLAGNVIDKEWEEPVFEDLTYFERGGVKIAVIGQAFPYTPIANPRYLIPEWSFGIREENIRESVDKAKAAGADLVVLASHNGFDVDRKLASRVTGIDVILTGHTHDAIPAVIRVKDTLLIATGSHGKFLGRLDLEVKNKKVTRYRFKLMPVFSEAIEPDPKIAAVIAKVRAPFEKDVNRVLGKTEGLLYRRGNFNGTFDDLICQAIIEGRDAQIALSPGFRWGATLLPGQDIRVEDVYSQTAITYPKTYRLEFSGQQLKDILEDVGDNLYNPDPYFQQGGDMVRVGGMGYKFNIGEKIGARISDMTLLSSGETIEAGKKYVVGGWASVNPATEGPPVYDLVSDYISRKMVVNIRQNRAIKVVGG
ncbi:MAG: thiosulfohydrolase SoxB [Rhodospirillales bacterium]|jgi:sulfur-oxidizing protein SoxB|nr:thiosulfohydrolase SoxB [Rhodospirillaceae bacterium]MDP6429711.1 thiosulfohydrolase SoxB [Rhodospirillales bacterium]MDP6646367.1 thiosulfohydrolase SoxB [Rhodospirillales bacterium]|tara:strand:- start:2964 stop:4649 length:1686 start_codon:yes stop_codon:yes gene_type:complete